jgi:hypothetical protein
LYDISYQQSSIEYPRITLLTSKEYIYNMYIINIPELDISSLVFPFSTKYFADPIYRFLST